jgi:inorganic pyrophosphatase
MCLVECYLIGLFSMTDNEKLDAEKASIPEVEDAVAARKVIAKSIEAYAAKFGKNQE